MSKTQWMQMVDGTAFDLERIQWWRINIEEAAYALARIPRFLGHTRRDRGPYFVAEHCVRVSRLLAGYSVETQLRGLLHDVPEAFIGDTTSPVKALIRRETHALDVLEDRLLYAVLDSVGLPHLRSDPPMPLGEWEAVQAQVKRADLVMLATERRDLMAPCTRDWHLKHDPQEKQLPNPLTSDAAERAFMDRFEELQAKRRMAA